MATVIVVVVVVVTLAEIFVGPRRSAEHGNPGVGGLIGALAGLLVVLTLSAWFLRSMRRRGLLAAPLAAGLSRQAGRQVGRAVRRGEPSEDPLLLEIERETAERTVTQARYTMVIFAGLMVLEAGLAAFGHHGTSGTVLFAVSAVAFAAGLVLLVYTARGARRYLAGQAEADQSLT